MRLRSALFRKYLMLPLSAIDEKRSGEMLSSFQSDMHQIGNGLDTFCDLLKEPFTFLGLMGMAFYCDWRLTACTLVVAPLVAFSFSRSGAAVKRYSAKNLGLLSDLMSLCQESLLGARVIKVFTLEKPLTEKFSSTHEAYFSTTRKSIKVQELATPVVELIGAILMAALITYGAHRIAMGELTAGQLVAFIVSVGLAQMPIKQLNNVMLKLKTAEAAAERIYRLLDEPESDGLRVGTVRKSALVSGIRFEGVGLTYGEKIALQGIDFEVKVGDCVALVGQSGSGKSSLVNLLPRLYDFTSGRIFIDGIDLRQILLQDLRSMISFVTQDTFLFNDTIYENIRYGLPQADRKMVERAAELAHCTDFIGRCANGFQTKIGDRGVCLSGGERQRLAIARAILKGAPILVLDEATSSLDSHSEALVQSALDELMFGKTTFLVAHRFSTVRRANRIYVLEQGRIRESGTHHELMEHKGVYSNLFLRQASLGETASLT